MNVENENIKNTETDNIAADELKNEVDSETTKSDTSKEIEKTTKELDDLKDKYLRLAAEYDNYRKRSVKEKSEAYDDAYISAASLFLPLLDNLDRAVSFEPENQGVLMLKKQVCDIFEKMGIKEMKTDNSSFDPIYHNAIMHEEDPEKEENIIVETLQKGYMLGQKVLRHAMVKVVN